MNYDIGAGPKVKYDWSFKKPMSTYLAGTILEEYGFRDFDNEDVPYKLSKITESKLKDPEVRQALITIIPNLDTDEIEEIAERNTNKKSTLKPNKYSIGVDAKGKGIPAGESKEQEADAKEADSDRMILVASSFEVEGEEEDGSQLDTKDEDEAEETGEDEEEEEEVIKGDEDEEEEDEDEGPVLVPRSTAPMGVGSDGSVSWKQGGKYKLMSPPYGRGNIKESSKPFNGLIAHTSAQSAYRALVGRHKGTLPPTIVINMGMSELEVGGGFGKTRVRAREKEGRRDASSIHQRLSGL